VPAAMCWIVWPSHESRWWRRRRDGATRRARRACMGERGGKVGWGVISGLSQPAAARGWGSELCP
jgi:hypothetical protein